MFFEIFVYPTIICSIFFNLLVLNVVADDKDMKRVKAMLASGESVNTQDSDGNTFLHQAAFAGHINIIKLLLGCGADIDAVNDVQRTALYLASMRGHIAVVRHLLDEGANVNAQDAYGNTPLHVASMQGNDEVVKELVRCGAKVNAKNHDGVTPLHKAASQWRMNIMGTLITHHADGAMKDNMGNTFLHILAFSSNDNFTPTARFVLEHVIINSNMLSAINNNGDTPLHVAARCGNLFFLEDFIDLFCDKINDLNNKKQTPLDVALEYDQVSCIHFLHKKGAQVFTCALKPRKLTFSWEDSKPYDGFIRLS